jgi:Fic-DOC domain mobile mystery protein B
MTRLRNIFGITPINPDEMEGLIPTHIINQHELNEWEQANIVEAQLWLNNRKLKTDDILCHDFIKKLHQKMFSKTWRWAGEFRNTDKNIGIDWREIPVQLKNLLDDVKFQVAHKSYVIDEAAVRFHHRLAFIHPFFNGNGRLSRLITDLFLISQRQKEFSWGKLNIEDEENIREKYILALKAGDKHDYSLLLKFVRT